MAGQTLLDRGSFLVSISIISSILFCFSPWKTNERQTMVHTHSFILDFIDSGVLLLGMKMILQACVVIVQSHTDLNSSKTSDICVSGNPE